MTSSPNSRNRVASQKPPLRGGARPRKISTRHKDPHCRAAWAYVEQVVAGAIPACLYVRQACQRALNDFHRQGTVGFGYVFDAERAGRVCRFVELLPHAKGVLAGQRIRLEPFQQFILTQLYGWCDRDGKRRFRRALILIPRGNGKSTLASGVALYALAAEGGQADVYCAATSRDQAAIVFRDSMQMARKSPELCAKLGIQILAHQVIVPDRNSRFAALSSESHGLDGLNISLAILDELAQHPDSRVYDAIVTGAGKRPSSLIFGITTAGSNRLGPGYQQQEHLRTVLNGTVEDEQLFGVIWTIDDEDDWTAESSLKKANPGYGISVEPTYVAGLARKAQQVASDQPAFKQKHLNIWTSADSQFIDMSAWTRNADPNLSLDDFEGEAVWIAVDLASKQDLSARVLLFTRTIDNQKHHYLFSRAYLPEAVIAGNATYAGWNMQDRLSVTPGEVTDHEYILDDLRRDVSRFNVQQIAVDPYQAVWIMAKLTGENAPALLYPNNTATMSAPMKELAAQVAAGRLHHNGDPVMSWCMSNLVARPDNKENVMPRRNLETQKIDIAVAAIMALGLEMAGDTEYAYADGRDLTFI